MTKLNTRQIAFAALSIAEAMIISTFIKLPSLPNGGSVTLFSMLIISMVGYWYGPRVGIITGIAYGMLQFAVEPFVVHPLQVLLDYPLAFGALGISGFFRKYKNGLIIGYVAAILGRLFFHELSGLIFYTTYVSGLAQNAAAIWATLAYNASYIFVEGGLTIAVCMIPAVKNALIMLKNMATK